MIAINPIFSLAHTIASAPGTQAILLGSVVSRAAQIPTGWDVTLGLIRRVATMASVDPGIDPVSWYSNAYGAPPDYSNLVGALAKTASERRALLQTFFEPTETEREAGSKTPTEAHRAIAKLVAGDFCRVILTTNFDRLIETALRDEGVEPVVLSTADAIEGAAPLVHQRCVLVKLHGDYLDDRIKNTAAELESYDPRVQTYLDRILDEFGLIVCGWSAEWDPALRAAFERCKARRYIMTWTSIGEPVGHAARLIALRGAQSVRITGADGFFCDLRDKVLSIAELGTPPPATVSAAVASLKRFVAENRFRVRLEDLLMGEACRVRDNLKVTFPVQVVNSADRNWLVSRVHAMEASTEVLRSLCFHGSRLATPDQERLYLRALTIMMVPDAGAGDVGLIRMARYPTATVLYAGLMGAVAAGNWRLLRMFLELKDTKRSISYCTCSRFNALTVLPTEVAELLHPPPRRHTPTSDHLHMLLSNLAQEIHPDPELLFDEVEIWVALAYLDIVRDLSTETHPWMPAGRFIWRNRWGGDRPFDSLVAEAAEAGSSWPPFAAGWFAGKQDRWEQVRAAFQSVCDRIEPSLF